MSGPDLEIFDFGVLVRRTSACIRKRPIPMQVCEECLDRHTARMGKQLTNEIPSRRCIFWHLSAVVFVRFCVSMQLRLSEGHFRFVLDCILIVGAEATNLISASG